MKSLLKLFLLTGMLTSLGGTWGMEIEKTQNEKKEQAQNVESDSFVEEEGEDRAKWSESERLWGADKLSEVCREYNMYITQNQLLTSSESEKYCKTVRHYLNKHADKKNEALELFNYLNKKANPESSRIEINMFITFLYTKGVMLAYTDRSTSKDYFCPTKVISNERMHDYFARFTEVRGIFNTNFGNINHLINADAPFMQWLLQDPDAIQMIRNLVAKGDYKSAWLNCCLLHSQYLCDWLAPERESNEDLK